jgi:uncharacterized protein (TIGR02996 family)
VTTVDDEHAALLRGIAKNLNNRAACLVYADWLQERSNPGWFTVANYPSWEWVLPADPSQNRLSWGKVPKRVLEWRLPFLFGYVRLKESTTNLRTVTKTVLALYADGRVKDYF